MKNTILFLLFALFLTGTVNAQSTVDSIAAKYKLLPMPEPLTIEKKFPVLGTYQISTEDPAASAQQVIVSLDAENKGIIWIDGLKEGKIKAYLKRSPATYRILSQKSESGKSVAEGTLIFDTEQNVLQIAIGKSFNDADPAAVFTSNSTASTSKSKTAKVKIYTASKLVVEQPAEASSTTSIQ
jgi:hypothetical protein